MSVTIIPKRVTKNYKSDGLSLELDAGTIAKLIAEELTAHITRSIDRNIQPDTGSGKMALNPKGMAGRAASAGKRSSARGVTRKGTFPRSFSVRKFRGKQKGKAQIRLGAFFGDWLTNEDRRGVRYTSVEGKSEDVVDKALASAVEKMVK